MTGDKPKEPQKAEVPNVVQGSFEERLRVASEQRAKVLAAKAAAEAEADVAPVRARKYIKPGSRAHHNTLSTSSDTTFFEAPEFADSAYVFQVPPKRASDLLPRLADASADVQVSKVPDRLGKMLPRLMLLCAFLMGAAAGCIGTIAWIKAATLPSIFNTLLK
jgi:hypothetical protein